MWKCHKCGKPVYFAERKQSLGFDWHPECLRCQECGKRLNPGQHAEHKGVPYCHVPCYGALFGPQLFGHGTRVESHKSFGQKTPARPTGGPILHKEHLENKIKIYNDFYDSKSAEVRCREVNGRLILEGALRVYWGVHGMIHLKEDDDQRTVVTIRKRNSCKYPNIDIEPASIENTEKDNYLDVPTEIELNKSPSIESDLSITDTMSFEATSIAEDSTSISSMSSSKEVSPSHKSNTLPSKLHVKDLDWDEIDDLLQVERKVDENDKLYQTMPSPMPSQSSLDFSDISPTESTKTSNSIESSSLTTTTTATQNQQSDETTTLTGTMLDLDPDQTISHDSSSSNTLKACDFEDFKKQINEEYINGTNDMRTVNDGTLKLNQPIDPSRINDSLKLYSENIMSKSFNGETAPLMALPKDNKLGVSDMTRSYHGNENVTTTKKLYNRLTTQSSPGNNSYKNYLLQKSESTSSSSYRNNITEDDSWIEKSINRSKSGPNCFGINNFVENDLQDTLKPSTIRKIKAKTINIKMDCYDDDDDINNDNDSSNILHDDDEIYINKNNGAIIDNNEKEIYPDADSSSTAMDDEVVLRRPKKAGSTAIKRRSGNRRSRTKLKRRCSINGHYYNRETSFFTPPHGSQMSVWITSMVNTHEVVNLLLEKYKVDNRAENFTLFIIRDNGEQRRLREEDYPLVVRIMMGPHEDVAKLFLVDSQETPEISLEVAQFLNLSIPECRAILDKYSDEQERETAKIRDKYAEMRKRITQRMESLKVRL